MSDIDQIVDAVFEADKDGNGLSAKEIADLMKAQEGVNDDTVKGFMDACDSDGDGLVTKQEFRKVLETAMKG